MTKQFKSLKNFDPILLDNEYVFCTFSLSCYGDHAALNPLASFHEKEGLTLVIQKETAKLNNLKYDSIFKCISLKLVSSLSNVGLTAIISKLLAENGISSNMYAGYYHYHVFVPLDKAKDAFKLLCKK